MKKLVVSLVVISCLLSCRSGRISSVASSDSTIVIIRDSIVERTKDSLIIIPADSSWLKASIKCDSNNQAYISQIIALKNGKNAKAPIIKWEKPGDLFIVCDVDSSAIYLQFLERYKYQSKGSEQAKKVVITLPPVITNELTGFQKFMIKSAWAFWIILVGYIIYKVVKLIIKLKSPI